MASCLILLRTAFKGIFIAAAFFAGRKWMDG
jgi:hypothetical protein